VSLPFRVRDAAQWSGGVLLQGDPDASLAGVSIDTRTLAPGQLFVAIAGPNHDAHDYLAAAAERGAGGLLVAQRRALPAALRPALPVLAVADTTGALGALAAGHRRGFRGPLVGITGSNGKTTTKEMCAAILEVGAPTLKTRGNLNNQFGLPLTLLSRGAEHRRAVLELGTNHPGEIAALAAIARPSVGVVTNVGTAHIEHLGSREGIAREKGALLEALPDDGTALVPAEDDFADVLAARTRARVLRFGAGGDVRAERVEPRPAGFAFRLCAPEGAVAVNLAGLGETSVLDALAAAGAALAAGARLEEVAEGLARHRPVEGRLERRELPGGVVLIDDSYNANPQSMEVALRLLAGCAGRRIAVLGDMGELGEVAAKAHEEAGRLAASLGIDFLVAAGSQAERVAAGAREGGMDPARIATAPDADAAAAPVRALLESGTTVLLKGSRAMRMERVGRQLEAGEPA
jgi:UDP-N-acetylmuramoyl-tripeptide--D-alanyl-D-alanine ligase